MAAVYYSWGYDSGTSTTSAWSGWNSSGDTWTAWSSNTCTATTATTTWTAWCGDSHRIAVASGESVWSEWVTVKVAPQREMTEGEIRQHMEEVDRQRVAATERASAEIKRKAEAEARALNLLEAMLSAEEMALYQETGRVVIKGEQHTYLIRRDSGDVAIVQPCGTKVRDACMHIADHHGYVRHDNVISMKLFLEAREKEFLKEANRRESLRQLEGKDAQALRKAVNQ